MAILLTVCVGPATADVMLPDASGGAYTVKVTNWRDLPFRRVVRQQYDFSCGSAALATLLRYHYSRPVTEADTFKAMYAAGDKAKIQKVGFSLLDMKLYLASVGIHADGYNVSVDDLRTLDTPAITLVKVGSYRHFVVIKGVLDDRVLVGDPALGAKAYSLAAFKKIWFGVIFMIKEPASGDFNNKQEWAAHPRPAPDPYTAESWPERLLVDVPTIFQITRVQTGP